MADLRRTDDGSRHCRLGQQPGDGQLRRAFTPSLGKRSQRVDHGLIGRAIIVIAAERSEEHTSELQSLTRLSYAVFCLKKQNIPKLSQQTPIYIIHHKTSLTQNYSIDSKPTTTHTQYHLH